MEWMGGWFGFLWLGCEWIGFQLIDQASRQVDSSWCYVRVYRTETVSLVKRSMGWSINQAKIQAMRQ